MSCNSDFAAAYAKAVDADMEAHHERMHQKHLAEVAAFELANPDYDYQAEKAREMEQPHLS